SASSRPSPTCASGARSFPRSIESGTRKRSSTASRRFPTVPSSRRRGRTPIASPGTDSIPAKRAGRIGAELLRSRASVRLRPAGATCSIRRRRRLPPSRGSRSHPARSSDDDRLGLADWGSSRGCRTERAARAEQARPLLNYRSLIARGHTNASRPSAGIRSSRPHDVERVVHHVRVKGNPAEVLESLRLVEIDGVPCFVDVENPSVGARSKGHPRARVESHLALKLSARHVDRPELVPTDVLEQHVAVLAVACECEAH